MGKQNLNQLFMVCDYEDRDVIEYFLTDDALGCKQAMDDVDSLNEDFDETKDDIGDYYSSRLIEELGLDGIKKLTETKYQDHWLTALKDLCTKRGIQLEQFADVDKYYY